MGGGGARETFEVVAALEQRHQAPVAMLIGDRQQALGRPGEIGFAEIEAAERVAEMRVEAGGNNQQVRRERLDSRQDRGFERLAERVAAVARAQRRIDDLAVLARFAHRPGAGVERHLMG